MAWNQSIGVNKAVLYAHLLRPHSNLAVSEYLERIRGFSLSLSQAFRLFGAGSRYEASKAVLHGLFLDIARAIRSRPVAAECENTIADCLSRLRELDSGEPLSDLERLGAEVAVHFVAGTTAILLCCALNCALGAVCSDPFALNWKSCFGSAIRKH